MSYNEIKDYIERNSRFLGLNLVQKKIIFQILEQNQHLETNSLLDFLTPRKLGFNFDSAPPPLTDKISVPVVDETQCLNKNTGLKHHFLIIGDNYEALNFLQLTHRQKVDVIYIDPPYNTQTAKTEGNSHNSGRFIYFDKFTRNGWLNLIRLRLEVAVKLLKPTGIIMVSIDDNEYAYLKVLMDQIFQEQNFVATIVWQSSFGGKNDSKLPVNTEYIILYAKKQQLFVLNPILNPRKHKKYTQQDWNYRERGNYFQEPLCRSSLKYQPSLDFVVFVKPAHDEKKIQITFSNPESSEWYSVVAGSSKWSINERLKKRKQRIKGNHLNNDWCWYWSANTMFRAFSQGFLDVVWNKKVKSFDLKKRTYELVRFNGKKNCIEKKDTRLQKLRNVLINDSRITTKIGNEEIKELGLFFSNPKPVSLIKKLLKVTLPEKKIGIVLDFYAGSGTTGQAVLELNRELGIRHQFILVTNNEVFFDSTSGENKRIGSDVTLEKLKRIMTGCRYKRFSNEWSSFSTPFLQDKLNTMYIKQFNIGLKVPDVKLKTILSRAQKSVKLLSDGREYSSSLLNDLNNLCRTIDQPKHSPSCD